VWPEEIAALQAQEESHWWFRARRRILAALLEPLVRSHPPPRVVDLGCGAGVDLERLPLGSALRVGVEPGPLARSRDAASVVAAPEAAVGFGAARREPAPAAPVRVLFVRGRAEATPLSAGRFDLVLALDVLEHLDDDAAALAEAARLLRPGGHLLITVPAGPALWSEHDEALGHRRRYRRAGLARLVEGSGLQIERLSHFNTLLLIPAVFYRLGREVLLRRHSARLRRRRPVSDTIRLGNFAGAILLRLLAAERLWLRRFDLPLGVSILCLACKPGGLAD
jgi:SAM-dependent methyltransferase